MEQHIRESMNDRILSQAKKLYDIEEIEYFGGFENFIYIYKKDGEEFILRFVHSDHKIYNYVLAEIEFIDYLDRFGASVSTVIHSQNDNIVEKIEIDNRSYCSISAFTKGLGNHVREEAKDPRTWVELGKQIGLLHKLTKDFNPVHKRPLWQDDSLYKIADRILTGDNLPILDALNNQIEKIVSTPTNKDNYGLIHTDLHFGNMVIDDSLNLTFFDFDDAAYMHFISDIAIVVFYRLFYAERSIEERSERAVWILNHFFKGYAEHNHLPKEELYRLEDFLKLRELTLYTVIIAGGPEVYESDWGNHYIQMYRDKIINREPFIDLNYVLEHLEY